MFNKAILIGRLGGDPETRYTPQGKPVVSFSLATSRKWRDDAGELREETQWHRIVVWGKQGEHCTTYLRKGSLVQVEGEIRYRRAERDGHTSHYTDIVALKVTFLDSKGSADKASQPPATDAPPPVDDGDDIPF